MVRSQENGCLWEDVGFDFEKILTLDMGEE